MGFDFLSQAARFLQERKAYKRWLAVFLCLSLVVTSGTFAMLKLYGQAMTHQVKVLDCHYEVHVHTEECYEEDEEGNQVLVCEHADEAEYVIHVHNDDCYDQKGNLVCPLQEHERHEHTEDCREEEEVLICEKEETEGGTEEKAEDVNAESADTGKAEEKSDADSKGAEKGSDAEAGKELACEKEAHTHDDGCYEGGTGCEKEEHEHGDGCYEKTSTLICETAEHGHSDGCYSERETILDCGLGEHEHEDGCYDEEGGLICEEEEHAHEDGCYSTTEGGLTCEAEEHTHGDGCYEVTETLICESEEHTHDDSCDAGQELTCETEEHEHDDSCYVEAVTEEEAEPEAAEEAGAEEKVTAEATEDTEEAEEGHTHTDDCYETREVLTCGELELHTHEEGLVEDGGCYDKSAYDEDGEWIEGSRPVCGLLQLEEHVHTEECFKIVELTPEEIAAINGGATLHVHTEACYDEEGNLICGHEVTHIHSLECYDEGGNLICGFEADHEHDAGCYDEEGNLICGYTDAKDHEHDAKCYDEEGNLTCGYEGVRDHEHTAGCYDEEGNLICGHEGSRDHEHDAGCYDEEGNLICGYADAKVHEHDAGCYDEEGNLICGYEGARVHEHDTNCYDMYGSLICGYEGAADHVHTEACYDEEGNLICGYVLREEYSNSRTFEGESYIVITKYNDDANIPEEAQLLVEEITPDSDKEHYERRETEYREMMEDEMASMRALLKIGFYMEGEEAQLVEIEPETPVMVSVQFLGEDGLPEGRPVTVIHFAEEGTEMLDGGSAVDNSTTFKMESFSEIAIGYVPEEEQRELTQAVDGTMRLHLADSFEYEDDAFQITFHIEGEAILPEDTVYKPLGIEDPKKDEVNTDPGSENVSEEVSGDEKIAELQPDTEADPAVKEEASGETAAEAEKTEDKTVPETEADAPVVSEEETEKSEGAENVSDEDTESGPNEAEAPDSENAEKVPPASGNKAEDGKTEVPKLRFQVEQLDRDSEEYKTLRTHAEEEDGEELLYRFNVMTYSLTYGGEELDLSKCKVTAEIRPAEALEEKIKESVSDAAAYLLGSDGKIVQNEVETISDAVPYLEDDEEGTKDPKESDEGAASDDIENKEEADLTDGKKTEEETGEEKTNEDEESVSSEDEENNISGNTEESGQVQPQQDDENVEALDELTVIVSTMAKNEPEDLAYMGFDGTQEASLSVDLTGIQMFATRASGQPNPKFTVQYYANLEVVAYNDDSLKEYTSGNNTNVIPIIDTGNGGTGEGGKLPSNGKGTSASPNGNQIRSLYVDKSTGKLKTKTELTEVYASRPFEYHKAPSINYINAVVENPSYKLMEVWILKDGKDAESTVKEDWDIYTYDEDLHFTNRETSGTGNYVYIKDNSTLRLVYETEKKDKDIEAEFYDYDIGDGSIYASKEDAIGQRKGEKTSKQGDGTWYMHTKQSGINSPKNYTGTGVKLAFGNCNTGSGLQYQQWEGNLLNKHNGDQGEAHPSVTGSYKGCTFGLVTGLKDGKIQYASGVIAPNLFNDGDAAGKTAYDNYSLRFNQDGDTHTLTAVNGTKTNGLESFNNPDSHNWKGEATTHYHIWTNNFWPMDSAPSYGTDGHDMKFGDYADSSKGSKKDNFAGQAGSEDYSGAPASYIFPWSDDDQDHNSYFGMHYQVTFDLVADYVGPLEYYFFGDDDMWVFLGDESGKDGKLVCDIGGVHSSVGEYLNLWDYIDKDKEGIHRHTDECYGNGVDNEPTCGKVDHKEFTLNFYYTERGESGSTCWMQFTLPSVSSKTPETTNKDYGHLVIRKDVMVTMNGKDYPALTKPASGEEEAQEGLFDGTEQGKFFEEKQFEFEITLNGPKGELRDDYAYVKYDKYGKPISSEDEGGSGILTWETIANGEKFTLKDGEYIRIQYLPMGTTYTIKELDGTEIKGVVYDSTDVTADDNITEGTWEVTGTIPSDDVKKVAYINRYSVYGLPETGGPGPEVYTVAGALLVLLGAGFLYRKKFRERRV